MRSKLVRFILAATVAVVAVPALGRHRASASGSTCNPNPCWIGGPGCNCIDVVGAGRRVEKVKAAGWITERTSRPYHFELWAKGWHHNTPDKIWDGSIFGGSVDSGWVTVNRTVPDGSGVCGRLWVKVEGKWTMPMKKMVCLKITR
jgi:hypothetical protein